MIGKVEVQITFGNGHEHATACVIPFESEAFHDAFVRVDHFDEGAHPILRAFCTDIECKRVRILAREQLLMSVRDTSRIACGITWMLTIR